MAVRVVQQEKYTDSYVLRGPRPEGGVYSLAQADESSLYVPQGTYGQDTLRPVTIKQVLDAQQPHPDADFKIDEVEITQVMASRYLVTIYFGAYTGVLRLLLWARSETSRRRLRTSPTS